MGTTKGNTTDDLQGSRQSDHPDAWKEPGNVCHPITTRATPERQMKETLYTRHQNTVEPMMVKHDRKVTLQALHTAAVVKAISVTRGMWC